MRTGKPATCPFLLLVRALTWIYPTQCLSRVPAPYLFQCILSLFQNLFRWRFGRYLRLPMNRYTFRRGDRGDRLSPPSFIVADMIGFLSPVFSCYLPFFSFSREILVELIGLPVQSPDVRWNGPSPLAERYFLNSSFFSQCTVL